MAYEFQFVSNIDPVSSFFDLLTRVPPKASLYSVVLILSVFLYYHLSKKSPNWIRLPLIHQKMEKNGLKSEAKAEFAHFTKFQRRGIQPNDVINFGITLVFVIIGVLFITQTIFFAVIPTQSMVPTLMPSDLVFVETFSIDDIEVGDIVVFENPRSTYLPNYVHRVISISKDGRIQTAGDNGKVPDGFQLTKENIIGKLPEINGKPIVLRGKGIYFMPGKVKLDYMSSDPMFNQVSSTIAAVQKNGPIYIILLLLMAALELGRATSRSRSGA